MRPPLLDGGVSLRGQTGLNRGETFVDGSFGLSSTEGHTKRRLFPEAFRGALASDDVCSPAPLPQCPDCLNPETRRKKRGTQYLSNQNVHGECSGSAVASSSRCFFVMFSNSFSSMSMLFSQETPWPLGAPLSGGRPVCPAGSAMFQAQTNLGVPPLRFPRKHRFCVISSLSPRNTAAFPPTD